MRFLLLLLFICAYKVLKTSGKSKEIPKYSLTNDKSLTKTSAFEWTLDIKEK